MLTPDSLDDVHYCHLRGNKVSSHCRHYKRHVSKNCGCELTVDLVSKRTRDITGRLNLRLLLEAWCLKSNQTSYGYGRKIVLTLSWPNSFFLNIFHVCSVFCLRNSFWNEMYKKCMVVASSFLKMLSGTYMPHWSLGGSIAFVGTSHMNDSRQLSVSRKRLVWIKTESIRENI
jgi:hypothetical protein